MPFFIWNKVNGKYYPFKSDDMPCDMDEKPKYKHFVIITKEIFEYPLDKLMILFPPPRDD